LVLALQNLGEGPGRGKNVRPTSDICKAPAIVPVENGHSAAVQSESLKPYWTELSLLFPWTHMQRWWYICHAHETNNPEIHSTPLMNGGERGGSRCLKQETGNRKQETGNRKQETGNRKITSDAFAAKRAILSTPESSATHSLSVTALILIVTAVGFPTSAFAAAHPVLYARNADNQSLFEEPYIRIVNEGDEPLDLAGYSIHYYIYESGKNASELAVQYWYTGEYGYSSQVEIQDLDEILVPGGGPGANMVIVMTLGGGAMLQPGQYVTVQNGIHAINWSSFNETDDWSHIASTVFVEAANIVLKDATGIVVSGVAPTGTGSGGTTTISGVPLFWLGEHWSYELVFSTSNYEPQDGDAYQNLGDGKVYVYFDGAWNPMEGSQSSIPLVVDGVFQSDIWFLENNDEVFEIVHFDFGMPGERRTLFSIDNQTEGVRIGNTWGEIGFNSVAI